MDYFEKDLEIPFLKVLSENRAGLPMSSIKKILLSRLDPTGTCAVESPTRPGEMKLHQRIGNFTPERDRRIFTSGYCSYNAFTKKYKITEKGMKFLIDKEEVFSSIISQGFTEVDMVAESESDYGNLIIEEGSLTEVSKTQRQRSQLLRKLKIKELKLQNERLSCCACGFVFEDKYDGIGKDFIIIHHLKPVHTIDETETSQLVGDALRLVVPVCSNCHSIIHKKEPMMTIAELKLIIDSQSSRHR
jgi:predicted HNH restriction endonuclease